MSDIWGNAVQAHQEGNFRLAKQLYDQVLEDAKYAQDVEAFSIVLYHLARLALDYDQEGPEVALHRFKKLLKSQERLGDNAGMSRTLREIAAIYDQQDELVSAIRYGERALTSAKEVYDQQQMAASYHLLGLLYQYAKLPSQAVTAMKEAQNHWEQLGNVIAWQNTTMVFADILEEQEKYPLCVRELRRLLKTLDDNEDIEDIAGLHYRVAALFGRQGDFQNALIHMLACLLRNQAIGSEFVQRDAMVLMDIRDRIGSVEFEFLVEKKLGTDKKNHMMMWLSELFPPETTDASLQQVPEPRALPEPIQADPIQPEYNAFSQSIQPGAVHAIQEYPSDLQSSKSVDDESVKQSMDLPSPPKHVQQAPALDDVPTLVREKPRTHHPERQTKSEPMAEAPQTPLAQPVLADPAPEPLDVPSMNRDGEFDVDDKTEERIRPEEASKQLSTSDLNSQLEAMVNWDDESGEFSQHTENPLGTENSLPNEWTQYTDSVQSIPEVPLPALTQHFLAALLGAMGMLALVQWLL